MLFRFWKFLRKNKRSVAILVAIVIGVIFAFAQMRHRDKVDAADARYIPLEKVEVVR